MGRRKETAEFLPQFETPRHKVPNSSSIKRKGLFSFLLSLSHIPNTHARTVVSTLSKCDSIRSKRVNWQLFKPSSWIWLSEKHEEDFDFKENRPRCGNKPGILSFVVS